MVYTWSIKTSSLPGLPVFIISHTSGVFPKHHGVQSMVFACLLGLKMPALSGNVWVWSAKTPTNILNVVLPAGL